MVVSRDEAAASLKEIERAGTKMRRLQNYASAGPHFIIWGLVWLIANSITDFAPQYSNGAWATMVALGAITSTIVGWFYTRGLREPALTGANYSTRYGVLFAVLLVFFSCILVIDPVRDAREGGALLSIIFPFIYMAVGVFAGWRLFTIGLVAAAMIMIGFFYIHEHFFLWMGVVAGGALILGGLWLRKA